jgi:APA family basic amino acid/polyamine antiporter
MSRVESSTRHAPATQARLGLPQSTALIVGSIIGVGIFSLPYSLASYGPISLVAMALARIGALALALMFPVLVATLDS